MRVRACTHADARMHVRACACTQDAVKDKVREHAKRLAVDVAAETERRRNEKQAAAEAAAAAAAAERQRQRQADAAAAAKRRELEEAAAAAAKLMHQAGDGTASTMSTGSSRAFAAGFSEEDAAAAARARQRADEITAQRWDAAEEAERQRAKASAAAGTAKRHAEEEVAGAEQVGRLRCTCRFLRARPPPVSACTRVYMHACASTHGRQAPRTPRACTYASHASLSCSCTASKQAWPCAPPALPAP